MSDLNLPGTDRITTVTGDPVARIAADATLLDVARALVESEVGALVVGDGEAATGLVSERDLVRATALGLDPATTAVTEVASTTLVWCNVEATLDEVAVQMRDSYVRHVLVEDAGRLVGIVSARDLLGAYSAGATAD